MGIYPSTHLFAQTLLMSVQMSMMRPVVQVNNRSVEEVSEQFGAITSWAQRVGSPVGYYASWFHSLVHQIEAERSWNRFQSSEAMHQLTLMLANRYFDALNLYMEEVNDAPECWQAAFAATQQSEMTLFQHIMTGSTALVQFDLAAGLATLSLNQGLDTDQAEGDIQVLLDIIELSLRRLQDGLTQASRAFKMMDSLGKSHKLWWDLLDLPGNQTRVIEQATQLQALRGADYQRKLKEFDQAATHASQEILETASRTLRRWFAQVSRWENQPVANLIDWLNQSPN